MKWIRARKGVKKGRKRELKTGTFFRFLFFWFHPTSHVGPRFFGFTPFLHVKLKRGKTRRKTEGIKKKGEKRERNREEKRLLLTTLLSGISSIYYITYSRTVIFNSLRFPTT
jgi:hypothetical protein